MEEKEQIEVVNETIIPSLVEFILSNKFSSTIEEFLELNCSHFKFLEESKGDDDLEWSHVHKKIYDEYQAVADNLFDEFAAKNKVSLHCIQSCCTNVVEGRFAPLFGEDENLWVVEELLSFSDFDSFIKRMRKVVRSNRK